MNVPKLRFKEFNDEYNLISFGDLVDYQKGFAFKSKDYKNNGIRIIRISDTTANSINNLDGIYIDAQEKGKYMNVELKTNDIIISSVGSKPPLYDSMVGKVVLVPEHANGSLLNQNAIRFRSKRANQIYLYNYLKQNKYTSFIESIMRGNANQRSITLEDLFKFELYVPNINEQNKVAKTLELLDRKIELQSKKIEDLKLFKSSQIKYILNKSISNEFPLKDLGYFISGNSFGKDKITQNGEPVVLYGDLYTKYDEEINCVEQFVEDNPKYIKSEIGDLLFPTSTTVDAISLISPSVINVSNVVYGGDLIIFKSNKDLVNPTFLSYQINHLKKKEFSKRAQGSTIIHISSEALLNSKVKIPSIEIQNSISNFGTFINNKINLEIEKLDKLNELKKELMQNMFV